MDTGQQLATLIAREDVIVTELRRRSDSTRPLQVRAVFGPDRNVGALSPGPRACIALEVLGYRTLTAIREIQERPMPTCEVCGNEYDAAFTVITADGSSYVFDSLECAAHQIAPTCGHCGCRVLGHGIQDDTTIYCCAHCAQMAGVDAARDRV